MYMYLVENAQHKNVFAYIQKRVCIGKGSCASIVLFIAIVLFSRIKSFPQNLNLRSLKNSLSVSKLDPRNLILDPRK